MKTFQLGQSRFKKTLIYVVHLPLFLGFDFTKVDPWIATIAIFSWASILLCVTTPGREKLIWLAYRWEYGYPCQEKYHNLFSLCPRKARARNKYFKPTVFFERLAFGESEWSWWIRAAPLAAPVNPEKNHWLCRHRCKIWLVGAGHPSEKYDFVNWDD